MNANTETPTLDVVQADQLAVVDAPELAPNFEPSLAEVKTIGYVQTDEDVGTNDPVVA